MAPAPRRRSGIVTLTAVIVCSAVACVTFYQFVRPPPMSDNPDLAPPLLYTDSPYTNIHTAPRQLCDAIATYNKSQTIRAYKHANADVNARLAGKYTVENLFAKSHTWLDKTSGVVGRDRLLCVAYAHDPNLDKMALMYRKWIHKCDRVLLFARSPSVGRDVPESIIVEIHPWNGDGNNNIWQRVRMIVKYLVAWQHLDEVDHILWVGDDSYVNIENLKKMLREPWYAEMDRMGVPLYLGHRLISGGGDVFVSASATTMNKVTLQIVGSLFAAGQCDPMLTSGTDDIPMAHCLAKVGIYAFDTFDEHGEDRFCPFNPWQWVELALNPSSSPWYPAYRDRKIPTDTRAYSMFPVAWHYMDLGQVDQVQAREAGWRG